LIWERLPEEHPNGELKTRHLVASPDGSVYLLLSTDEGEEIYRSP